MKTIHSNPRDRFGGQIILRQLFRGGVLLSCIAALGFLSATVQAEPPWSPPVTLSYPAVNAGSPEVAISDTGWMVAAWVRQQGNIYQVQASLGRKGAGWTAPVNLSQKGQSAFDVSVAIDRNGIATAVWTVGNMIQTSTYGSGRSPVGWSSPMALSDVSTSASQPHVVVDAAGNTTAMWIRYDMNGVPGLETAYRPVHGQWTAPLLLAQGAPRDFMLVVNPRGDAAAIWNIGAFVSNTSIYVSNKRFGGAWSAPYNLAPLAYRQGGGKIGIAADGALTACWRTNTEIRVADKPAKPVVGNWGPTQTIYINRAMADYPTLAVTPSGDVMAAWITYVSVGGSYNYQIGSAVRPAGGTWTAPVLLTDSSEHDMELRAGTTNTNSCVLTWVDANSYLFKSSTWSIAEGWYDFAAIAAASDTSLAVAGNTALAIWMGGSFQAQVSIAPID